MCVELEKTNIEVDNEFISNDFSTILNSANDADVINPFHETRLGAAKKIVFLVAPKV